VDLTGGRSSLAGRSTEEAAGSIPAGGALYIVAATTIFGPLSAHGGRD
jgi:hypothetical protein